MQHFNVQIKQHHSLQALLSEIKQIQHFNVEMNQRNISQALLSLLLLIIHITIIITTIIITITTMFRLLRRDWQGRQGEVQGLDEACQKILFISEMDLGQFCLSRKKISRKLQGEVQGLDEACQKTRNAKKQLCEVGNSQKTTTFANGGFKSGWANLKIIELGLHPLTEPTLPKRGLSESPRPGSSRPLRVTRPRKNGSGRPTSILLLYIYISLSLYIYIYIYMYTYIYTYIHTYIYTYTYTYACTCTYTCTCTFFAGDLFFSGVDFP